MIDQTLLPFTFKVRTLNTSRETALAIREMVVRGAPLIGATAACGLILAASIDSDEIHLQEAYHELLSSRPTAVNLRWALLWEHPHTGDLWLARGTPSALLEG